MAAEPRLICASEALAEGGDGVRFVVDEFGLEVPAFAIRFRGRVHAYVNRCAHVPVELDWVEGAFFDLERRLIMCATHGAVYDPESGRCLGGPCRGASLRPVHVVEREGAVWLLPVPTEGAREGGWRRRGGPSAR